MGETIDSVTCMQDVTTAMVDSMADLQEATLTDSRDGQDYTVKKINGQLWMTRNLAIGCNGSGSTYGSSVKSVRLTSTDSNLSGSWSTTTVLLSVTANNSSTGGADTAAMQCSPTYGAWYNYPAATAETITGSRNSTNTTNDICPLNWHLPTGPNTTSDTDFNKLVGNTTSGWQATASSLNAFDAVAGGYYASNYPRDTGYGYWWSAVASDVTYRYYLGYNKGASQFTGGHTSARYGGVYVRCAHD